jgi:hypothetical protein
METQTRNHGNSTVGDISIPTATENPADMEGSSTITGPCSPAQGAEGASRKRVLCPSAPADVKAILLGVVQSDGSVAFIRDRIEVTREFLDIAGKGRAPETRFRFSSECIGSGCKQWANGGCSLPERLADILPRSDATDASDAPLPSCSIRAQCRWFDQRGADACRICPMVVTRGDSQ